MMAAARRAAGPLARRDPQRERKRRILIFCEGTTEPEYFTKLRNYLRAIPVEVATCELKGVGQDPLKIVNRAGKRWAEDRRDNGGEAFDEAWCVVDRDEHASLPAAIKRADDLGINLVLSTPCFEYWLLLHFVDHRAAATNQQVMAELRRHLTGYDKHVPEKFPFASHGEAIARAKRVVFEPADAPNPSTNAWRVVEAVRTSATRSWSRGGR